MEHKTDIRVWICGAGMIRSVSSVELLRYLLETTRLTRSTDR